MPVRRVFPPRDAVAAIRAARAFYRGHGLNEWAAALPARAARVRLPRRDGFDAAFAFPPVPVQLATQTLLFETLGTRPVRRLDAARQYGEPWVSDLGGLRRCAPRNRPLGPYVLLFRAAGPPSETLGLKAAAIESRFGNAGWAGLTLPEYLVLQRVATEAAGDHHFDAREQWLLDAGPEDARCAALWNPDARRIEVRFARMDQAVPGRGAHPALIVPM